MKDARKSKEVYLCTNCGISKYNRFDWCDLGCGSDYNEMVRIDEHILNQIADFIAHRKEYSNE